MQWATEPQTGYSASHLNHRAPQELSAHLLWQWWVSSSQGHHAHVARPAGEPEEGWVIKVCSACAPACPTACPAANRTEHCGAPLCKWQYTSGGCVTTCSAAKSAKLTHWTPVNAGSHRCPPANGCDDSRCLAPEEIGVMCLLQTGRGPPIPCAGPAEPALALLPHMTLFGRLAKCREHSCEIRSAYLAPSGTSLPSKVHKQCGCRLW